MSDTSLASIAFGIAAYMLMLSAFQTLNSEGGALWVLYTVPRSLESILYEKAQLWCSVAFVYPIAVFGIGIALTHRADLDLLGLAGVVALGVPIYSIIAVSLGVFGCDPLAQEVQTRLRPTYVYLYLLLAGLYTYAIFSSSWWQRVVLIVLSASLAAALWQKARDELPYLLDPAASPPARVSASDGIIGAMMFFVFQGIGLVLARASGDEALSAFELTVIFSIAGALTYGAVRWTFWRSHTQGVPAILGERGVGAALAWGVSGGLLAGLAGVLYSVVVQRYGLIEVRGASPLGSLRGAWLVVLAVVAAPLFEEFIFRGLVFGGLRRSMSTGRAVLASAALFAIVHPPASMIPVFGLGACAALAYRRTGALLAPMTAHAVYNALILSFGLLRF